MIKYHPTTHTPSRIQHFEDYGKQDDSQPAKPHSSEPWKPFQSRIDFDFAELVLDAALNNDQVEALIQIIKRVAGGEKFTLSGNHELRNTWKEATTLLTPVGNV